MKKAILAVFFVALSLSIHAQVTQHLTGVDSLKIGSMFQLNIQTDFPLQEVLIPDTLSAFRVLEKKIRKDGSGSVAELSIIPLRTGTLSFPKLELKSSRIIGSGSSTDAFRVFVLRSRAEADTLLRDIKPLRSYPAQLPFWLYPAVLLVIVVLAIMLIILAFKQKAPKRQAILPKPVPTKVIAPHQKALDALEELWQSGLMYRNYLEYHFRLSMILREYLEASLGFGAIQMTTAEIAESLLVLKPQFDKEYINILHYCDMVKFAKVQPDLEDISLQTEKLRSILKSIGSKVHV